MTYESDERLKGYLDTNQMHREQMCLAVLAIDKRFSNVRPRHPRGGPDGGRDIDATFSGKQRAFGAVGFVNQANDSEAHRNTAKTKFKHDLSVALEQEPQPEIFVFFTNTNLTLGERGELIAYAKAQGLADVEIFDRERIRLFLDSPDGLSVRFQYLNIPMSEAEQATFFARWGDDIQTVISEGFGRLEMRLNRIQFLHEISSTMNHFDVTFELNREYSAREIGHFRAFMILHFKEATAGAFSLAFGSTDNNGRRDAATPEQLATSPETGIRAGICGRQWEIPRDDADVKYHRTGSFTGVGLDRVECLSINYRQDEFVRSKRGIQLRDLNESPFVFWMSQTLAEKIKTIHIYANEYKLAEIAATGVSIDQSGYDVALPLHFTEAELADPWVILRPRGESVFYVRFSEQTPKRLFAASEIIASQSG